MQPTSHSLVTSIVLSLLVACTALAGAESGFSALPHTESPSLQRVKPPTNPKVFNAHMPRDQIEKLPISKQQELTTVLLDLEKGCIEDGVAKLKKALANLLYVRGGSIMRGDFAKIAGIGGADGQHGRQGV